MSNDLQNLASVLRYSACKSSEISALQLYYIFLKYFKKKAEYTQDKKGIYCSNMMVDFHNLNLSELSKDDMIKMIDELEATCD